jgi:hypothetical protein
VIRNQDENEMMNNENNTLTTLAYMGGAKAVTLTRAVSVRS